MLYNELSKLTAISTLPTWLIRFAWPQLTWHRTVLWLWLLKKTIRHHRHSPKPSERNVFFYHHTEHSPQLFPHSCIDQEASLRKFHLVSQTPNSINQLSTVLGSRRTKWVCQQLVLNVENEEALSPNKICVVVAELVIICSVMMMMMMILLLVLCIVVLVIYVYWRIDTRTQIQPNANTTHNDADGNVDDVRMIDDTGLRWWWWWLRRFVEGGNSLREKILCVHIFFVCLPLATDSSFVCCYFVWSIFVIIIWLGVFMRRKNINSRKKNTRSSWVFRSRLCTRPHFVVAWNMEVIGSG